jgi:hypothetical protein
MKTRETEIGYIYTIFDLIILNFAIGLVGWLSKTVQASDFRELSLYLLSGNLSYLIAILLFFRTNFYLRGEFRVRVYRILKRTLIFFIVLLSLSALLVPQVYDYLFFAQYTALFLSGRLLFCWLGFNYLKFKRKNLLSYRSF